MKKNHRIIIKVKRLEENEYQTYTEIVGDPQELAIAIAHEMMDNPVFGAMMTTIMEEAINHCVEDSEEGEPEGEEKVREVN